MRRDVSIDTAETLLQNPLADVPEVTHVIRRRIGEEIGIVWRCIPTAPTVQTASRDDLFPHAIPYIQHLEIIYSTAHVVQTAYRDVSIPQPLPYKQHLAKIHSRTNSI